jgi:two-component system chemotaxis response regulator CheY
MLGNKLEFGLLKVLLVDDQKMIRIVVRKILEGFGIKEIAEAENVAEGFDKILQSRPDLIICDVDMKPSNGFALVSAVRENPILRRLPILMLTSVRAPEDIVRAQTLQVQGYLLKPTSAETIKERIVKIFS